MYSLEQSLISLPSASLKAFVDRYSVLQCIACSPWGGGGGEGEPGTRLIFWYLKVSR